MLLIVVCEINPSYLFSSLKKKEETLTSMHYTHTHGPKTCNSSGILQAKQQNECKSETCRKIFLHLDLLHE